jgi:hypothetical protein
MNFSIVQTLLIMPHILAKLRNVKFTDIENILKADAPRHAMEGMYLEHLWQNTDFHNEVLFLFRVDDLNHAREYINKEHSRALEENPDANLPEMKYLS